MFYIQNGKISSEKTLALGEQRKVDLNFCFDTKFDDGDTFSLSLGEFASSLYSFTNEGLLTFSRVDFSSISQKSISASIIIKRNGSETLLSDTLNITAAISGGGGGGGAAADLGNYTGEIHLTGSAGGSSAPVLNFKNKTIEIGGTGYVISDDVGADFKVLADKTTIVGGNSLQIQSYKLGGKNSSLILSAGRIDAAAAVETCFDCELFSIYGNLNVNGGLCLNNQNILSGETSEFNFNLDAPYIHTVNLDFEDYELDFYDERKIVKIYTFYDTIGIDFNIYQPETNFLNKCYTKELWICPLQSNINTLRINDKIQVIGELPNQLEMYGDNDKKWCYVFICRCFLSDGGYYLYAPTIQYSHKFLRDIYF